MKRILHVLCTITLVDDEKYCEIPAETLVPVGLAFTWPFLVSNSLSCLHNSMETKINLSICEGRNRLMMKGAATRGKNDARNTPFVNNL